MIFDSFFCFESFELLLNLNNMSLCLLFLFFIRQTLKIFFEDESTLILNFLPDFFKRFVLFDSINKGSGDF